MESQNYLGIYLSRETATVVCLNLLGRVGKVLGSFSVSVEEKEQANMQDLAALIARGCTQRRWSYSEVAVALDCAIFMQHSVQSEFSDPKQISATIRFDTEEALATDITNIALAFEITSAGQEGSELTVFTAERKILSEILESLQAHNLDPVTIEPDVSCLSRFICRKAPSSESRQPGTLFGILSNRNGYLIIPPSSGAGTQKGSAVRTFLVGPTQNRGDLLTREVLVTSALVKSGESINYLKVFDSAGTVNHQQLSEKLSIESDGIGWLDTAGGEKQIPADGFEPVDYAIAYGAALALSEKGHCINFRDDFSPFQGKKLKMQQALKFAVISVTVLLISVGLFFQAKLMSRNKDSRKLRAKFAQNYAAVMPLDQKLSAKAEPVEAVRKLRSELGRIRDAKKGLITIKGEKSVSAKLTLVLTAFNKCAAQTRLNIKSITVAKKDIIVTGDTSSRQNTLKFFDTLRNNGLDVLRHNFDIKGGRDNFNITLAPK